MTRLLILASMLFASAVFAQVEIPACMRTAT